MDGKDGKDGKIGTNEKKWRGDKAKERAAIGSHNGLYSFHSESASLLFSLSVYLGLSLTPISGEELFSRQTRLG